MFTEKFALLNLLKAIQSISPDAKTKENNGDGNFQSPLKRPPETRADIVTDGKSDNSIPPPSYPNVMEEVLKRHEQISNRVKNKKPPV